MKTTIVNLRKQMYPTKKQFLQDAYAFCTKTPRGYILIDLTVLQNDKFRVRNNLFSDTNTCILAPL